MAVPMGGGRGGYPKGEKLGTSKPNYMNIKNVGSSISH